MQKPETTVCACRFVVTTHPAPYENESDPRKALAKALDDFILGTVETGEVGRAMHWLTSNVLEAKVVPYEAD